MQLFKDARVVKPVDILKDNDCLPCLGEEIYDLVKILIKVREFTVIRGDRKPGWSSGDILYLNSGLQPLENQI